MKTRSFIVILSGIFLIGSAGIAPAGGMKSSGEGKHREMAEASPPIMVPNDYLEYLEIEQGLETGSLTSPGVFPSEIPGPSERVEVPEGG